MHPSDHFLIQIPNPLRHPHDEIVVYELNDPRQLKRPAFHINEDQQLVLPYDLSYKAHRFVRKTVTHTAPLEWRPVRVYWQGPDGSDRTSTPARITDPQFLDAVIEAPQTATRQPSNLKDQVLIQTEAYGVDLYVKCHAVQPLHTITGWTPITPFD